MATRVSHATKGDRSQPDRSIPFVTWSFMALPESSRDYAESGSDGGRGRLPPLRGAVGRTVRNSTTSVPSASGPTVRAKSVGRLCVRWSVLITSVSGVP
jgi:hypothetical protein